MAEHSNSAAVSPPEPAAKLDCICRKVSISLAGPPINRSECCCMDCRFGLQWFHQHKNGPPPPSLIADVLYFPNWLSVTQGQEQLEVYMIKEGYNTAKVVAACCGTILIADHPFYQQKQLGTYNLPGVLTLKDAATLMPPQRRVFQDDLSPDQLAQLEPFEPLPNASARLQPGKVDLAHWQSQFSNYVTIQRVIESASSVRYMDPRYEGKEPMWNKHLKKTQPS